MLILSFLSFNLFWALIDLQIWQAISNKLESQWLIKKKTPDKNTKTIQTKNKLYPHFHCDWKTNKQNNNNNNNNNNKNKQTNTLLHLIFYGKIVLFLVSSFPAPCLDIHSKHVISWLLWGTEVMTFGTVDVNHLSVITASLNNRLWLKPVSRVVLLPCATLGQLAVL